MQLTINLLALLRLIVAVRLAVCGNLTALFSPQVRDVTAENTGASNHVDKSRYKIPPFYPCSIT